MNGSNVVAIKLRPFIIVSGVAVVQNHVHDLRKYVYLSFFIYNLYIQEVSGNKSGPNLEGINWEPLC